MKIAYILAVLSAPLASQAAMVQFHYQSTLAYSAGLPNAGQGTEFFVTITLDNGGGLANGTWSYLDVETITYQVGTGAEAYSYTFDANLPNLLWISSGGVFSTDAGGNFLTVPESWNGIATDMSGYFYINGANNFFGANTIGLGDAFAGNNITPTAWTATVVPEPSAALLGGLGALALLRRRRR